ncbi:hypothetical protein AMK21_18365 [Streptomyces sp. CB00316]|uniref:hypothetical protein n=1 Tax=unclassified Streptomyces TaxID=2593676 RepID=UPI000939BCEC|nr:MULTISPECIES: hypothetical protein [unclassified Streptomyces]MBT2379656.1 hypothetical protein [Streptomyces sp. ISL-111]MBT2426730.1 hypothetical protein [Streptomyces sp. ISL-112]MBT2463307.1 hypothetical protein [Streptomyces sp. ISL-63]OKJ19088.1 hypothetical protein AMK21_18365 [Streptomyces sp. CB00316]
MSEIAASTVHEAYAFACMRCGYGWEQSYEIEHHVDVHGHEFVVYKADGERVPSPLSTPTCANCDGHVVRIMRAGRVAGAQQLLHGSRSTKPGAPRVPDAAGVPDAEKVPAARSSDRHWRLSDLLHPFHRR